MSTPLISVIHATRGRPQKAAATYKYWLEKARNKAVIEYIFVVNEDDETAVTLELLAPDATIIKAAVKFSAPAWNVGANASNGKLLIQGQDDVFPPQDWDSELCWTLEAMDLWDTPTVIRVADGYRKGPAADLCCTAIATRAYVNLEGCFINPIYRSMFSDDEFTILAKAHAEAGDATLVDLRDKLVFRHENPIHNKEIPVDDTHRHENSQEAYAIGATHFYQRNAALVRRGLKTW